MPELFHEVEKKYNPGFKEHNTFSRENEWWGPFFALSESKTGSILEGQTCDNALLLPNLKLQNKL